MKIDLRAIGARMRAGRKRAEMTQDALAERVGVTGGAVSQWENGQTMPDIKPIIALCQSSRANSADEILMGTKQAALDQFEQQLLDIFRQLPPEFRLAAHESINRLWELAHPGKTGPAAPFPRQIKHKP